MNTIRNITPDAKQSSIHVMHGYILGTRIRLTNSTNESTFSPNNDLVVIVKTIEKSYNINRFLCYQNTYAKCARSFHYEFTVKTKSLWRKQWILLLCTESAREWHPVWRFGQHFIMTLPLRRIRIKIGRYVYDTEVVL